MVRVSRIRPALLFCWVTVIEIVFGMMENTTYVAVTLPSTGSTNQTTNSSLRITATDILLVNDDVTMNQNRSLRCTPNPCLEGRVCSVIPKGYRCVCPDGWMGQNCITRITCSAHNPCLNNGRCFENGLGILSCICPLGFTGPRCGYEIATPCDSDPCGEGKICVEYGPTKYRCQCPEGYTGDDCNAPRVGCIPNSCENNGTCIALLGTGYVSCFCPDGYKGDKCEIKDLCHINPCANGGTCGTDSESDEAECKCSEGYYGIRCEFVDRCHPNPCMNAGSCLNIKGTGEYTCVCSYGYKGKKCEYDPCFSNPCSNGGVCKLNRSSASWYSCQCTSGWEGDKCDIVTSTPTVNGPCDPNPCKNGCQCKASCRHENGYICLGSEGQLGKNCDLPPPSIKCGSSEITVEVDRRIVSEYGGRSSDVTAFMSNSSTIVKSSSCQATSNKTDLRFVLGLPFNDCGTVTSTMSDGSISVTNTIWINKLFPVGAFDVPIPVVTFVCQYGMQYHVVTSLSPSLGYSRTVAAKGKRTLPAVIELCKSGNYCPGTCPTRFSLKRRAVYTVGERLHLRISPKTERTTLRLQDLFLSCSSDVSQEHENASIVSVVSECLPTKSLCYNPTEVTQFRDGLCVNFRVPFLAECGVIYIHAKLKACHQNCSSHYQECQGRSRRSVASKESLEVYGPIYVLRGNDGVLKTTIYPGDDDLSEGNSSDPTRETPEDADGTDIWLRITVLIIVSITVIMLGAFLCFRQCDRGKRYH